MAVLDGSISILKSKFPSIRALPVLCILKVISAAVRSRISGIAIAFHCVTMERTYLSAVLLGGAPVR